MTKGSNRGTRIFSDDSSIRGTKYGKLKNTEPVELEYEDRNINSDHESHLMTPPDSSPLNDGAPSSPFAKSPWMCDTSDNASSPSPMDCSGPNILLGSLVREEGHIYSLAASGDLLYTGSDSKNIRVWKNQREYAGFKSNSGLVKAIVIARQKIFTGHQDGKIRVWRVSSKNDTDHKRVGTLPTLRDYIRSSMRPSSYVEVKRNRNVLWLKHIDAISCLGLSEDQLLLYSASWDKTFKVWRISNSKCLESVTAHDDAVNSVVSGFDGLVFTGSADGTVKVWRREYQGKGTKHFFSQTLLKQECAVTALSVNSTATIIYCGSSDGLVNYFERDKHLAHGGVLRGHNLAVLCLATAGNLVFSGSADMGICVWRRGENGDHLFFTILTGHSGPVKCLAVEKDPEQPTTNEPRWIVYSGSLDKSVKMWSVTGQISDLPKENKPSGSRHGGAMLDSGSRSRHGYLAGMSDSASRRGSRKGLDSGARSRNGGATLDAASSFASRSRAV